MQNAAREGQMGRSLRPMRLLCEYVVFYAALLYFGVVGTAFTAISSLIYPLVPRSVGKRFARSAISFLFRTYLRMLESTGLLKLELEALDRLRDRPGLVIAPNHPCLLDAVLIIARLPQVGCIMKATLWDNIVLGGGARLAGYIRNDSAHSMVRDAATSLRAGQSLLAFPEGTRTTEATLNRFRGGFALSAKCAGAPIQTVFIESNSGFLGKHWPLLRKPRMPLCYRAWLGERFEVEGDVKTFLVKLEAYYREELRGKARRPDDAASEGSDARSGARFHA